MLSNRPYLLRAFYQWIVDSHCNPILVVNAHDPDCKVPKQYIEGDEILFNISASAIRDLKMLNKCIEFKATFSGIIHLISIPVQAVLAIYAEENGEGIYFDEEGSIDDQGEGNRTGAAVTDPYKVVDSTLQGPDQAINKTKSTAKKSKPFLKLVE